MSIEQLQTQHIEQLQNELVKAMALAEKLQKQKGYLVDLLIKDISPSTTVIINKYLDWLEEDERN